MKKNLCTKFAEIRYNGCMAEFSISRVGGIAPPSMGNQIGEGSSPSGVSSISSMAGQSPSSLGSPYVSGATTALAPGVFFTPEQLQILLLQQLITQILKSWMTFYPTFGLPLSDTETQDPNGLPNVWVNEGQVGAPEDFYSEGGMQHSPSDGADNQGVSSENSGPEKKTVIQEQYRYVGTPPRVLLDIANTIFARTSGAGQEDLVEQGQFLRALSALADSDNPAAFSSNVIMTPVQQENSLFGRPPVTARKDLVAERGLRNEAGLPMSAVSQEVPQGNSVSTMRSPSIITAVSRDPSAVSYRPRNSDEASSSILSVQKGPVDSSEMDFTPTGIPLQIPAAPMPLREEPLHRNMKDSGLESRTSQTTESSVQSRPQASNSSAHGLYAPPSPLSSGASKSSDAISLGALQAAGQAAAGQSQAASEAGVSGGAGGASAMWFFWVSLAALGAVFGGALYYIFA